MDATATGHCKRALQDLEDRALFDLRDAVVGTTKTPGWVEFLEQLSKGRDAILKSLTQGQTRTQADYARQIGYLAGLEEAPNVVKAITDAASQREARNVKAAVADRRRREGASP